MVRVKRANVVLRVKDGDVKHYLELGYNVIDEKGNVVQEAIPTDLNFLQTAYVQNKEKIAKLEAEIKKLKSASEEAPKRRKREE